ncbi:hypothetical protein M153_4560002783 [Pseudoloma neurophilia]|uniref:Uncharacterized protein n=1 Tax=Pseudoloma neurophilia TaxID=146866 RepID=A0A0R0M6A3_9MICR|nr:hypothetical protein M153_4560002783 [Pseudoloma neurophilia]
MYLLKFISLCFCLVNCSEKSDNKNDSDERALYNPKNPFCYHENIKEERKNNFEGKEACSEYFLPINTRKKILNLRDKLKCKEEVKTALESFEINVSEEYEGDNLPYYTQFMNSPSHNSQPTATIESLFQETPDSPLVESEMETDGTLLESREEVSERLTEGYSLAEERLPNLIDPVQSFNVIDQVQTNGDPFGSYSDNSEHSQQEGQDLIQDHQLNENLTELTEQEIIFPGFVQLMADFENNHPSTDESDTDDESSEESNSERSGLTDVKNSKRKMNDDISPFDSPIPRPFLARLNASAGLEPDGEEQRLFGLRPIQYFSHSQMKELFSMMKSLNVQNLEYLKIHFLNYQYISKEKIPLEKSRPLIPLSTQNSMNSILHCLYVCESLRKFLFINTNPNIPDLCSFLSWVFDMMTAPKTALFDPSEKDEAYEKLFKEYVSCFEMINDFIHLDFLMFDEAVWKENFLRIFMVLCLTRYPNQQVPFEFTTCQYILCNKCEILHEEYPEVTTRHAKVEFRLRSIQKLQDQVMSVFLPPDVKVLIGSQFFCENKQHYMLRLKLGISIPELLILEAHKRDQEHRPEMDNYIIHIPEVLDLFGHVFSLKSVALKHKYEQNQYFHTALVLENGIWYLQHDHIRMKIENIAKFLHKNTDIDFLFYER